jgi:hypothetical protein
MRFAAMTFSRSRSLPAARRIVIEPLASTTATPAES